MKKLLALLLAAAMVISMLTVVAFAEGTGNESDVEGGDEMNAGDVSETPSEGGTAEPAPTPAETEDTNPPTGVALAVVPMMVAAAAAVVSKKH